MATKRELAKQKRAVAGLRANAVRLGVKKRREVKGPVSKIRLRERRQASSVIRTLGLRLQEARVALEDRRRAYDALFAARGEQLAVKDEELAKVKREYDALAHEWARDKAERVSLERVVIEQAKRIYNWPSVKKEGG